MYLKTLRLKNFRSFLEEEISIRNTLTIFVGENNGGKSNAIDAIRLITPPLGLRREIYCEMSDRRSGAGDDFFEIEATYGGLNPGQQGRLLSATVDETLETARFKLVYDVSNGAYARPVLTGGAQGLPPEPGCHDTIRHVYLPPLRDAKRALASGNPTRIMSLLNHFLEGEAPEALAQRLKRTTGDAVLARVDAAVGGNLEALTAGVRKQGAALGFSDDEKLIDIARDLRFKLADSGIEPEDLRYSGHGYANLLYMATIAVELEKVKDADLTLFLVEEPEAHLHPQLQAAVLNFLEEQASKSRQAGGGNGPAGQLQIIVATHSPHLSAWVESKNLIVFRSTLLPAPAPDPLDPPNPEADEPPVGDEGAVEAQEDEREEPQAQPIQRRITRCVTLAGIDLSDPDRRKVDRYLDVTRSALLFGGRVLLVEGIAEAILLPIIARKFVLHRSPERLRIFRSAVFVPIDGVDFAPYLKLLLTPFHDVRIADRVVVITDGDTQKVAAGQQAPGQGRKTELDGLARERVAAEKLSVFVNTYSLETELVVEGNDAHLRAAYLTLHPRSGQKWDDAVALGGMDQAKAIQALFEDTRKGDFAQLVAESLQADGAVFSVPDYLRRAIEALVE